MTATQPEIPAFPVAATGCPMDPPPLLSELREERPVSRVALWDGSRPWLVTRHADVRSALRDPRLSSDVRRHGFPFLSAAQSEAIGEGLITFIRMDPPEHTRQRRMLTAEFMVKRMEAMRPEIDATVDALLDEMTGSGTSADLMEAFALPLPSLVICRMLGVPYEDHGYFQERSQLVQDTTASPEEVNTALGELAAYLDRLATEKAADPADDLISRLVAEQETPGHLSRLEVAGMALNLLIAGHETTANQIGLGILALRRQPDQWAKLVERPELVPAAVEELLRHQSIVPTGLQRVAREDLEIGGTPIKAGEGVLLQIGAANRDPRAFEEPDGLDIERNSRQHMAFGFGVHQCLGQPLARLELQCALAGIVRRLPGLRVTRFLEELDFRHGGNIYGLFTLPVEW
ncbi:cytochrome P450 [Streptomyces sp. NPDC059743]|uniref:cytochrome P450 n=1 Tax=Streptomyces sp. NPDC059743 TaxID=3346928 RepID=UPI00365D5BCB